VKEEEGLKEVTIMARAVQGHFNIIIPWYENRNVINYFNRESIL
jgi:hypothetical protein